MSTSTSPPPSSSFDLALLRGAVEELPLGVATTRGGAILYANTALERLYGAAPGELDNKPVDVLFDGDILTSALPDFYAERVFDGRVRARALDGRMIDVEMHAERYQSASGAIGGFVLARDVTPELGALGRLVDALGGAIFRVRVADGCVEEMSLGVEALLGLSASSCVADARKLFSLVDGGDRDRLAAIYRRITHGGETVTVGAEVTVRKADGTRIPVRIHATGRCDATGAVRHVEGVVIDASARRGSTPPAAPPPIKAASADENRALLAVSGNLLREVGHLTHASQSTARGVRTAAESLRNAPSATVDELTLASDKLLRALSAASALNRRVRRALDGRVTRGAIVDVLENVRLSLAPLVTEEAITMDARNCGRTTLETRLDALTLALTQLGLRAYRLAGYGSLYLAAERDGADTVIEIRGEPGGDPATDDGDTDPSSSPTMTAPADLELELRAVAALLAPIGGTLDEDVSLDGVRTRVRLRSR